MKRRQFIKQVGLSSLIPIIIKFDGQNANINFINLSGVRWEDVFQLEAFKMIEKKIIVKKDLKIEGNTDSHILAFDAIFSTIKNNYTIFDDTYNIDLEYAKENSNSFIFNILKTDIAHSSYVKYRIYLEKTFNTIARFIDRNPETELCILATLGRDEKENSIVTKTDFGLDHCTAYSKNVFALYYNLPIGFNPIHQSNNLRIIVENLFNNV